MGELGSSGTYHNRVPFLGCIISITGHTLSALALLPIYKYLNIAYI